MGLMYALDSFRAEIGDIPATDDPRALRAKSHDWSDVSPILRKLLEGKSADLVVQPRTKEEVIRAVAAAARHRIPVTPRGAGTANYGQSVPLHGGIVLDMTGFTGIVWKRAGAMRAYAGTVIDDIDAVTRLDGWELRMHPSTKRIATIGGYVSGGSAGIGSCVWGGLREMGNIAGLEVIGMQETPSVRELRGKDVALVQHAFGTNCVITEVEMPLAPAWDWTEAVVVFDSYMAAVRFGVRFAEEDGLIKKLVSVQEWPTPGLWRQMRGIVPRGYSTVCCIVASPFLAAFEELIQEFGGTIASVCGEGEGPYGLPLYEFAFGHALQQMRRSDPSRAAVQGTFHGDDLVGLIERVHRRIAGQGPLRMELTRSRGRLTGGGGVFITYKNDEQIRALTQLLVEEGVEVNDVHSVSVTRHLRGRSSVDASAALKRTMDPYGLLNPGKWETDDDDIASVQMPAATV
jgi:FAD/FMN-containing dehydrogenase